MSEKSGLNVVVSKAGFNHFAEQVRDAIGFLTRNAAEVRRLVAFPGVAWRNVAAQSDEFPAELVRVAGSVGIALRLSRYPVSDVEPPTK